MRPAYPKNSDPASRPIIAILAWLLSLPAVFMSLSFLLTGFMSLFSDTPQAHIFFLALLMIAAWVFLAVMTLAWLNNRRCNEAVPIVGTIIGLPMAVLQAFPIGFLFYASTACLAFYLVYWHLLVADEAASA